MNTLEELLEEYYQIKSQMEELQQDKERIRKKIFAEMKKNEITQFKDARIQKRLCPKYDKAYYIFKRNFDEEMNTQGHVVYEMQEALWIGGD